METRDQLTLLGGVGLGAGLMYLLDPAGGRRRRAVARDKTVHGLKVSGRALRKTSVDMGNRTKGLVAKAGSHLHKGDAEVADDAVLSERVRSCLGRFVSHPSAIQVEAASAKSASSVAAQNTGATGTPVAASSSSARARALTALDHV